MQVSQVRTESGSPVTLDFGGDVVTVRRQSPGRQRAVRLCGGAALLFAGLAAVAVTLEDRGNHIAGTVLLSIAASVATACAGGLVWWLVLALKDRRRPAEPITAESVRSARSQVDHEQVTVTLQVGEEPERAFSARGHAGTVLASQFGCLLAAEAEPPASSSRTIASLPPVRPVHSDDQNT